MCWLEQPVLWITTRLALHALTAKICGEGVAGEGPGLSPGGLWGPGAAAGPGGETEVRGWGGRLRGPTLFAFFAFWVCSIMHRGWAGESTEIYTHPFGPPFTGKWLALGPCQSEPYARPG
jgi:hypothetical protein